MFYELRSLPIDVESVTVSRKLNHIEIWPRNNKIEIFDFFDLKLHVIYNPSKSDISKLIRNDSLCISDWISLREINKTMKNQNFDLRHATS